MKKKLLAILLAAIMVMTLLPTVALAENTVPPENSSGETNIEFDIDFEYEMVIPADTVLTKDEHTDVLLGGNGIVSIEDVKHNCDTIDVFYTVDLDKATLTSGTDTITTTYGYSTDGTNFDTLEAETPYTVYTGGEVKTTYVNVTVADEGENGWESAPVGNYKATVVFNFAAECAVDLEAYPNLMKIVKIDGDIVYYVMWKYDGEKFGPLDVGLPIGDGDLKDGLDPYIGVPYSEGDYFHKNNKQYSKCALPEKLNVYDEIVFFVTRERYHHTYCYSIPAGSTYDARSGGLIFNASSKYDAYTEIESGAEVTLNGNPVSDTGEIHDGDSFVIRDVN